MENIIDIISNLGFPIAMCVALFYYMATQNKQHEQSLDDLRATLEENTKVLTELTTLIKMIADNEKE
mgnify:CR=1 FL=1